jgi:hypothetical protein
MSVFKSRGGKLAAGTVVVLVAAGGGAAFAATQLDSPGAHDNAIISDAAGQLGVQPSALSSALKKAYDDQIQARVTSGELSQSQADALKKSVDAGDFPLFSGGGPGAGGPNGAHPSIGFGFGFGFGLGGDSGAAASYLGLTAAQIQSDLRSGKTLAQIAVAQGKTADGLVQQLLAAQEANLDKLVTAGKLSSDQEQTIEKGLTAMITNLVNGTHPAPSAVAPGGGPAPFVGRGGFGGPGRLGARLGFGPFGADLTAAATYLGLTTDQLQTDLKGGKTLAQIATDQSKTADGLVHAILAAQEANLDKLVTAGKLSSDQEQTIEKGLTTMITNIVNGTRPSMGGMGHFGFRRGGHAGASFRGPAPAAPGVTE